MTEILERLTEGSEVRTEIADAELSDFAREIFPEDYFLNPNANVRLVVQSSSSSPHSFIQLDVIPSNCQSPYKSPDILELRNNFLKNHPNYLPGSDSGIISYMVRCNGRDAIVRMFPHSSSRPFSG